MQDAAQYDGCAFIITDRYLTLCGWNFTCKTYAEYSEVRGREIQYVHLLLLQPLLFYAYFKSLLVLWIRCLVSVEMTLKGERAWNRNLDSVRVEYRRGPELQSSAVSLSPLLLVQHLNGDLC